MNDAWLQDIRYAVRSFARSPALMIAAVICLALGIGANAAIFGVVDTLLFRSPPHVVDPDRVVRLYIRVTRPPFGTFTSSTSGYPLYTEIRDAAHGFDALAAFTFSQHASLGRGPDARRVDVVLASASFFTLLGVRPAVGRFYGADEDRPGGPAVAVLGYEFWRSAFGGDSTVIGRQLALGRGTYTVIGVAPERFTGVNLQNVDVWVPIAVATPELMGPGSMNRGSYFLQIIGRLGAGGVASAQRQATLALRGDEVYSGRDSNAVVMLGPIQAARGPQMSQNAKVSIWLAAVAVIVLVVACANVANLLLARSLQRRREVAIQVALGAGWARLARQVLTESLLLAVAGGIAALLVTLWTGPLVRTFLLPDIPSLAGPLDVRIIAFTAAVALLTGVAAGVAPALQLRRDLTPALKAGAGEGRYQHSRLRSALLIGQVALTMVLIVGAGLFARSLRNVEGQDFGFDPTHTILVTMDLRAAGYTPVQINAVYLQLLSRLEALPAIEAAAATVAHPLGWSMGWSVKVPGRDSIPQLKTGGPYSQQVTPRYFAAIGTPVRGRGFTASDRPWEVAVVNETMARLLWPGENAIGKCFYAGDAPVCTQVIGVVADARRFNAVEDATMQFYVPLARDSTQFITALLVRPHGRAEDWIGAVRAAIQQTAPNLPYAQVTPLADLLAPSIRPWRLGSTMFGGFALLALVLSAVGLYGVFAYTVTQRTHEMGVRVALGAQRWDVQRLMVSQAVRIAAMGAAVGAAAALLGGRVLSSLLFGISPRDPLVLFVAVIVPIVVAAVASYVPARRASRVDPVVALRYE